MLTIENLAINFGGLWAVNGCSFTIEEGGICGLIGPNGAGKTTLFQLISGTLRATRGKVIFNDEDISQLSLNQRFHKGLVRTFQITHEFSRLSALENLMMVTKHQDGERIFANWLSSSKIKEQEQENYAKAIETLKFLELEHVADALAGNLSGGQKKLLELGRAMMSDAKLILLDEIAAGINRTLLRKLEEKILQLNQKGFTFLVIEHDMEMVQKLCPRVICMVQGQILVDGDFDTVRNHPQIIEAYLGEKVS